MAIEPETILQRLEEIEVDADMGVSSPDSAAWLCQVVRELIGRLARLEAVAEAAQEVCKQAEWDLDRWTFRWPHSLWLLKSALAALEEGKE